MTDPADGVITEAMISEIVHAFYARIRSEPVLGPIFERAIGAHWDAHLAKLCDFWSSVLLQSGRFRGAPMAVHLRIPELGPAHFQRWLALFDETVTARCPPAAAALFRSKAATIGRSLQMGIAHHRGTDPRSVPA